MDCYNPHHPESAYHCGALVSVYAAIQHRVMPEVNAGLAQRYYSSASQNPALVLGQLARMSNHHREKITSDKYGDLYDELLNEASIAIGDVIPVTLDLEGQAYFALGYRQMSAKISKRTSEFKGENKTDKKEEEV